MYVLTLKCLRLLAPTRLIVKMAARATLQTQKLNEM